jgi:3-isopropylmalate/(R)-2-methylmalate dehydratase small subunit
MKFEGFVYKFGDNINTDFIISGRYKFSITDMKELSKHLFEDIRPGFWKEIVPGKSIIVGGLNFGLGSSREQAPWVIKEAGILCVIAKGFARIFYRNSFNIGLPLIEANTDFLNEGDKLNLDLNKGIINNITTHTIIKFAPLDKFRRELIKYGGIINYLKKYRDFKI